MSSSWSWSPVFSKIVQSSIWDEPDDVRIVFVTMLAMKDRDHVVRMNAYEIGRASRKTEQVVLKALRVLSSPDERRIEPQPHEGKRIEWVGNGWLILNGQFYQNMMRDENRRAYQAEWQKNYRKRRKDGAEGVRAAGRAGAVSGAGQAVSDGLKEQKQALEKSAPAVAPPPPPSPLQAIQEHAQKQMNRIGGTPCKICGYIHEPGECKAL